MPTASGKRRREKRPPEEAPEARREPPLLHLQRGRRRRTRRGGASSRSRIAAGLVCFQLFLLLAATVSSQYTDGGVVELDCTSCSCEGSAGDSEVLVFDNPSSGQQVVSVDGDLSEIAETSCGTSIMAVGSTVYELSGDGALGSRNLEAVEMSSSDDCSITGVPSTAECYTGDTAMTLDGDVSMTLTICLCYYMDGSKTIYRSQVFAEVVGASTVSVPDDEIEICLEAGFIMQLTTATVEGEDYYYNFDLVVPGRDSSSDLSVSEAPDEDAQAFICGELEELEEPTPSPVTPVPPTPEPTESPPEPTPAPVTPIPPTPEPTSPPPEPTPSPVTPIPPTPDPTAPPPELTPAPVTPIPPTPDPTAPPPEPTPAPVTPIPPTPDPTAPPPDTTPSPVAAPTPPPTPYPTTPPSVPTLAPVAPETPAPVVAATVAPSAVAATIVSTSAPSVANATVGATAAPVLPLPVETPAPSPAVRGLASPAPTSVGVDGGGGGAVVTTVAPTAVATSTGEGEGNNMEGQECMIPEEAPCTSTAATIAHTNQGVGSYYDPTCAAAAATASEGGELPEGCDPSSADSCRFCLFNTPRWQEKNPGEDLPDLVDCPCCVLDVYKEDTAINEDGVRCEWMTPAPVASTSEPSTVVPLTITRTDLLFEDKPLNLGGGSLDAGVVALGLLALLTFFPVCVK